MTPRCLQLVGVPLLPSVHQLIGSWIWQLDGFPRQIPNGPRRAPARIPEHGAWTMPQATTCPECKQGDVISISMNVSGQDLAFSTCHACEAKWWHRDGEQIVLSDVIETVVRT